MFKILNRNREVVGLITSPINPVIDDTLTGMNELRFSVPASQEGLELEGYIRIENEHEYVIKEISTHGHNREVIAIMNVEELIGKVWTTFRSVDTLPSECIREIVVGTGWTVIDNCPPNKRRNLYGTKTSSWDLIFLACDVFNIEVKFDTFNKTITTLEKGGTDRGTYFMSDLNLKQLMHDSHTHKLITRVIPIGKDGLTIEEVNNGKNYIENHSYSNKIITGIWQSDRYTNAQDLKDDATLYLEEMCVPYESYECKVSDLYRLENNPNFEFNVGDVIYLIDNITKKKIQQRIIKHTKNLTAPDKDTINLANKSMSFTDYYKRLQLISNMTEQAIGSDGMIPDSSIEGIDASKITGDIKATLIDADTIVSEHIRADQILSQHIKSQQIFGEHIVANAIDATHIQANSINSNHITSNTIQAEHIQAGAISAGSSIVGEGAIGSAQISSLDANKINAGEIDTSKVKIKGENGFLFIENNTLYVVDNNKKIRCELGVIENNSNYGFVVRGADGQTIMLDHNGVHNAGITDGAIDNRKVSENANISGKKLDIDSVVKSINEDGSVTLKGTKVQIGNTTLDVKLSEQTDLITEQGQKLATQQSEITANTNAIKLKVDNQTYTEDKKNMTSKLDKATSDISVMQGQIALKVGQTEIDNAVNSLNGSVDQKIKDAKAEIKTTTDNISQRVSTTETNLTTTNNKLDTATSNISNLTSRVATAESKITDSAIINTVSSNFYTKEQVDGINVGGYNYIKNGDFKNCNPGSTSMDNEYWGYWSIQVYYQQGQNEYTEDNTVYLAPRGSNMSGGIYQDVSTSLLPKGTEVTLSYRLNSQHNVKGTRVFVEYRVLGDGSDKIVRRVDLATNKQGYNKHTFTLPTDINYEITRVVFEHDGVVNIDLGYVLMSIGSVKLEKGNRATDFSPNPEEIELSLSSKIIQTADDVQFRFEESGGYNKLRNSAFKDGTNHWYALNWNHSGSSNMEIYPAGASEWCPLNRNALVSFAGNLTHTNDYIGVGFDSHPIWGGIYWTFSCLLASHRTQEILVEIIEFDSSGNRFPDFNNWRIEGNKSGGQSRNNWHKFEKQFTLRNSGCANFIIRIFMGRWNGESNNAFLFMAEPLLVLGHKSGLPYTPNADEVYAGITSIDQDGIKVQHESGSYSRMNSQEFFQAREDGSRTMSLRMGAIRTYQFPDAGSYNYGYLGGLSSSRSNTSDKVYGQTIFGTSGSGYLSLGFSENWEDNQNHPMSSWLMLTHYDGNCNVNQGIHAYKPFYMRDRSHYLSRPYMYAGMAMPYWNRDDLNSEISYITTSGSASSGTRYIQQWGADGILLGVQNGGNFIGHRILEEYSTGAKLYHEAWGNWDFKGWSLNNARVTYSLSNPNADLSSRDRRFTREATHTLVTTKLVQDRGEDFTMDGCCIVEIPDDIKYNIGRYDVNIIKYGRGDIWVSERTPDYFVVESDNDIKFTWVLEGELLENTMRSIGSYEFEFEEVTEETCGNPLEGSEVTCASKYALMEDEQMERMLARELSEISTLEE